MSTPDDPSRLESDSDDGVVQRELEVDRGQEPLRLDRFLHNRLADVSRTRIQAAIQVGNVTVNGAAVRQSYKVRPLDKISIITSEDYGDSSPPQAEDIPLDVIYEDDVLAVINKPAGMVVHPGHGNNHGTLINALLHRYPQLPDRAGGRPGLIHRLDKDTTGLLVVGLEEKAQQHLARQFFQRTIHRRYEALVWGVPDEPEGRIDCNIGRDPRFRTLMAYFPEGDAGKTAITNYKLLEDLGYVSRVECRLETGRTHQIRVHMKMLGLPVFGDEKYGGDSVVKGTVFTKYKQFVQNCFAMLPRQALHAAQLGFEHPVSGERLMFESPVPDDMGAVIERWRTYLKGRRNQE